MILTSASGCTRFQLPLFFRGQGFRSRRRVRSHSAFCDSPTREHRTRPPWQLSNGHGSKNVVRSGAKCRRHSSTSRAKKKNSHGSAFVRRRTAPRNGSIDITPGQSDLFVLRMLTLSSGELLLSRATGAQSSLGQPSDTSLLQSLGGSKHRIQEVLAHVKKHLSV